MDISFISESTNSKAFRNVLLKKNTKFGTHENTWVFQFYWPGFENEKKSINHSHYPICDVIEICRKTFTPNLLFIQNLFAPLYKNIYESKPERDVTILI